MNSALILQRNVVADREIELFQLILTKCFKRCANNFYTHEFVNEESECLQTCARKYNEFLRQNKAEIETFKI
jgi:hypothetical protein